MRAVPLACLGAEADALNNASNHTALRARLAALNPARSVALFTRYVPHDIPHDAGVTYGLIPGMARTEVSAVERTAVEVRLAPLAAVVLSQRVPRPARGEAY